MVMVLYDADCGFCTRCSRMLVRGGARANFVPLQTADLAALGVDSERAAQELPAVLDSGAVGYGAEAFRAALGTGPWWMRVGAGLLGLWPLSALGRWVYRLVAANRYRMPGSAASCRPPASGDPTVAAG